MVFPDNLLHLSGHVIDRIRNERRLQDVNVVERTRLFF